ncbi:MAG: hypothetical protein AABY40_04375 [Nanoarchaeota archaeon]
MSLKDILDCLDCFQQGRKESKVMFSDNSDLETIKPMLLDELENIAFLAELRSYDDPFSPYSRAEVFSYILGTLSTPKAIYEVAKFFVSGEYRRDYED